MQATLINCTLDKLENFQLGLANFSFDSCLKKGRAIATWILVVCAPLVLMCRSSLPFLFLSSSCFFVSVFSLQQVSLLMTMLLLFRGLWKAMNKLSLREQKVFPLSLVAVLLFLCSFVKHSFGPVSTATQSSFAFSILACFSFFFLFFHRLFRHVLAKLIYFLEIKALNSCFYSLINFF